MEDITSDNLENEGSKLWEVYSHQTDTDNPDEKQFIQDFWANYKQLIVAAKKEKQSLLIQPSAPVSVSASPWADLIYQHWQGAPSVVEYQKKKSIWWKVVMAVLVFFTLLSFSAVLLTILGVVGFYGWVFFSKKGKNGGHYTYDF